MQLHGDLGSFPIIDIIQLLHGTKKTGVLRISGKKGESQLVFHAGDLVSANYLNNRVRIGQVLVSAGAITEEQLAQALEIQKNAGEERKPLVITLLDHNMVDETAAYNGLESLIEMTIVEVLTWKDGQFSLDQDRGDATGGYHFSRTNFSQRILLNSQGILMDSLRIYDEKMRDGSMDEVLSIAGITNLDLGPAPPESGAPAHSPDRQDRDNAPSQLHQLLAEQRDMIQSSRDQGYRKADALKKLIAGEFPAAAPEEKRHLLKLLSGPVPDDRAATPPDIAVIVISRSPLVSTMIKSICFQENIYAHSSDSLASLAITIRLLLCQTVQLVIFLDVPHDDDAMQDTIKICKDIQHYPQALVVLAACSRFWGALGLQALSTGIRSIIPKPCTECAKESSVQQAAAFCTDLAAFLRTLAAEHSSGQEQRFFACITRLRTCKTRTDIADAVLAYLSGEFERAIVFVVTEDELVAEHSFGITGEKGEGLALLPNLRVPLDDQKIFEDVVKTGELHYGFHSDSTWPHQLYKLIGRQDSPEVLVFPLIRASRVEGFIYADFGSKPASAPSLRYLEALLQFTTAQMSIAAYRQKLKSMLEQMRMHEIDPKSGRHTESQATN